jgi:hypothetical protein
MISLEQLDTWENKVQKAIEKGNIDNSFAKILKSIKNVQKPKQAGRGLKHQRSTAEIRERAKEIFNNFIDSYIISVLEKEGQDIVNDVIGQKGVEVRSLFHRRLVNELNDRRTVSTQNCIDSLNRVQERAKEESEIAESLKYYEAARYMNEEYKVNIGTYMKFIEEEPDIDYESLENRFWWRGAGEVRDAENLKILENASKDKKIPMKMRERILNIIKARKSGREKLAIAETKLATSIVNKLSELLEARPDITEKEAFDELFNIEGIEEDNIRELIRMAARNLSEGGERDSDMYRSLVKLFRIPSRRRLV